MVVEEAKCLFKGPGDLKKRPGGVVRGQVVEEESKLCGNRPSVGRRVQVVW